MSFFDEQEHVEEIDDDGHECGYGKRKIEDDKRGCGQRRVLCTQE